MSSFSHTDMATNALYQRVSFKKYEREVKVDKNGMAVLYMFGYPIAAITKDERLFIKKPSIIDTSLVSRQFSSIVQRGTEMRYWWWNDEIGGMRLGNNWTEIMDAGSVKMFNHQNPFKLYEY